MSRHPDSGGPAGELPSRDSPVSPDRRRDPPGPARRGRAHLLRARVLQAVQGVPANIAKALRLPPRSSVYQISGVRHADNGPFQHVTAYVPLTIGTALSDEDLSKTSLIGAIERVLGVPIKLMEQVVDAALAPRQIAELLQVRSRSPLLLFERTYFAASGEPVEYAITYQTPRRYPYRLVLSRAERRS